MKFKFFDGTAEEFKVVAHLFEDSSGPEAESLQKIEGVEEMQVDKQYAIRRMITRRDLPWGQKALYKALADGRLEYSDFLERADRTAREMSGLLGALGRRINATDEIHQAGLPGDSRAVIKKDYEGGVKYISLTEDALAVVHEPEIWELINS